MSRFPHMGLAIALAAGLAAMPEDMRWTNGESPCRSRGGTFGPSNPKRTTAAAQKRQAKKRRAAR